MTKKELLKALESVPDDAPILRLDPYGVAPMPIHRIAYGTWRAFKVVQDA